MIRVALKSLLKCLNDYCQEALVQAAQACIQRGSYEILPEHLLLTFLNQKEYDIALLLNQADVSLEKVRAKLHHQIEQHGLGQSDTPVYSQALVDWFQEAWLINSVELGYDRLRSGALLLAVLRNDRLKAAMGLADELSMISLDQLNRDLSAVFESSHEHVIQLSQPLGSSQANQQSAGAGSQGTQHPAPDSAIALYTQNFTQSAREGKIDPVFCREDEIRQMIDILGRRRKNNPIAVGEAGVGKTAVIEGLALKIAQGDVPETLQSVELLSLDLQAMQAGASVRGEFERRLKSLMDEVKGSPYPIILFIDEVHTLIGAGGQAGTGDAANILKPALARGELRTIAATTWAEYKKYIEKDSALERRFQAVKLDEPTVEQATVILRGLRKIYESAHGVLIRDDALSATAHLSARYLSGRKLPDKAVDLMDTACSRVKQSLIAMPPQLQQLHKTIDQKNLELESLRRDWNRGLDKCEDKETELLSQINEANQSLEALRSQWQQEKELVEQVLSLENQRSDDTSDDQLNQALVAAKKKLVAFQGETPLVHYEVCPELIAKIIADWTGIPLGSMVQDDAEAILTFYDKMLMEIKGQDAAVKVLDSVMRISKLGLNNPEAPIGVLLFAGPSGVGKTQTAHAVAKLLFGGERFITTFNMSEYMDKHSTSKLIGSAPGLVGYGEGGALTEAIRQKPYSVLLLDEVEKAHPDVMNLFYQVFSKGELADGENRMVNFRNTLIIMTSNLADDQIAGWDKPLQTQEDMEALNEFIRPSLKAFFKPALLGRMQVVPFQALDQNILAEIVQLKLDKLRNRFELALKTEFKFTDEVVKAITARCSEVESGARNIDYIINSHLLPLISNQLLGAMVSEQELKTLTVNWDQQFFIKLS